MPASQQQQGGGSDNALDFLWMIVLIVGGLALIWYIWRHQIASFVLDLRYYEIIGIDFVLRGYSHIASLLHLPVPNFSDITQSLNTISSKPAEISLKDLVSLSNDVGKYLMIPFGLIIAIFAIITYLSNITERFKHVYTMDTLRKSENRIWPHVTPVMKVDLVKKGLDEGPWATSLTPMLFAKKHNLLIEHKVDGGRTTVSLNDGAAHRIFALQVGKFWRDIETFPLHIQAMFAIFLARANRDRKNADNLLNQIAASASSDKLNYKGVTELVRKHKNSKYAKFAESRHAYILGVMATLLELARTDGVLATAEFLWLKPVDRALWYVLNSVGRQTAFPEMAGAFAHWTSEKKAGRALRVPMVEEAVKALDLAIKEIIYEPEDE
jgi:intracellular multiplication protein IcmP